MMKFNNTMLLFPVLFTGLNVLLTELGTKRYFFSDMFTLDTECGSTGLQTKVCLSGTHLILGMVARSDYKNDTCLC